MTARPNPATPRRGFSITELLVVIGVIAILLGLLFPALRGFVRSGKMTKSMSNMRQISTWMTLYSSDNREYIVPSQFDYSGSSYPGKVRSKYNAIYGDRHKGTWTDILWTINEVGFFMEAEAVVGIDYRLDSPDAQLYEIMAGEIDNPFRAGAANTKNTPNVPAASLAKPFGPGAAQIGQPGYFAANNFFNTDLNLDPNAVFYTTGQIRRPERSMYLVDSFAGETIDPVPAPYQVATGIGPPTAEVDFRYNEVCVMLFLDGHQETVGKWDNLNDLETFKGIRIQNLHKR